MNSEILLLAAAEETAEVFTVSGPLVPFTFTIAGFEVNISETIIIQWFIIALLGVLFFFLGRNLKVRPDSRRQAAAEWLVGFFNGSVESTMGSTKQYRNYIPYMGALFMMSLLSSLAGVVGLKSPTSDLSVIAGWGVLTFFLVQFNKVKTGGAKSLALSLFQPIPPLFPLNIISEFANPLAQVLRHFANIVAGSVIMGLIYFVLNGIAYGLFSIGVPVVLSLYFDFFSAVIQAYIFMTLTMSYVKMAEQD